MHRMEYQKPQTPLRRSSLTYITDSQRRIDQPSASSPRPRLRSLTGVGDIPYQKKFSAGFDLNWLQTFLVEVIPQYATNEMVASTARAEARALRPSGNNLSQVAIILQAFVDNAKDPPAVIVFEAHSLLGLLYAKQGNHTASLQSLTKALWIARSTEKVSWEQLAMTLHRLGQTYSDCGDDVEAGHLLQKALDMYEHGPNVRKDDACVLEAQMTMSKIQSKRLVRKNGKKV